MPASPSHRYSYYFQDHWKEHKKLCNSRVKHAKVECDLEAAALRDKEPFVSHATLRKWYYDNVDIIDYAVRLPPLSIPSLPAQGKPLTTCLQIVQTLELYKGRAHPLWRTHAVVFSLTGGEKGTSVTAEEIDFENAEAVSFADLASPDIFDLEPLYLQALGAGSRIILVFMLNDEVDLILVENHDLPAEEEYVAMERDEMWRMHIRMRGVAQIGLDCD